MKTYYVILNGRVISTLQAACTSIAVAMALDDFGTAVTVSTIKPEPTFTERATEATITGRTRLGRWLQAVGSKIAAI